MIFKWTLIGENVNLACFWFPTKVADQTGLHFYLIIHLFDLATLCECKYGKILTEQSGEEKYKNLVRDFNQMYKKKSWYFYMLFFYIDSTVFCKRFCSNFRLFYLPHCHHKQKWKYFEPQRKNEMSKIKMINSWIIAALIPELWPPTVKIDNGTTWAFFHRQYFLPLFLVHRN